MVAQLEEKLVSRRRSDVSIIIEILSIALNGVNKTEIVYKANLNFRQARKYLDFLSGKGLIAVYNGPFHGSLNGKNGYRTTEKGRAFVRRYNETLKLVA
jgi:predicted transcriptional regulator